MVVVLVVVVAVVVFHVCFLSFNIVSCFMYFRLSGQFSFLFIAR